MTKKEFVKIMKAAIQEAEKGENGREFTCNILEDFNRKIKYDYISIFSQNKNENYIPVCFGIKKPFTKKNIEKIRQVRLNALTMYMVQALEFETYRNL